MSFFHSIKTALSTPSAPKTKDEGFETLRTQHTTYFEDIKKLQLQLSKLSSHYSNLKNTSIDLWSIFDDQSKRDPNNKGQNIAASAKDQFTKFDIASVASIIESALSKVKATNDEFIKANSAIANRDEALSEFDYYSSKCHDLTNDKQKCMDKGKEFRPSEQEKLDRNMEKKKSCQDLYVKNQEAAETLMKDLQSTCDEFLYSIIQLVIEAQNSFAVKYSDVARSF